VHEWLWVYVNLRDLREGFERRKFEELIDDIEWFTDLSDKLLEAIETDGCVPPDNYFLSKAKNLVEGIKEGVEKRKEWYVWSDLIELDTTLRDLLLDIAEECEKRGKEVGV